MALASAILVSFCATATLADSHPASDQGVLLVHLNVKPKIARFPMKTRANSALQSLHLPVSATPLTLARRLFPGLFRRISKQLMSEQGMGRLPGDFRLDRIYHSPMSEQHQIRMRRPYGPFSYSRYHALPAEVTDKKLMHPRTSRVHTKSTMSAPFSSVQSAPPDTSDTFVHHGVTLSTFPRVMDAIGVYSTARIITHILGSDPRRGILASMALILLLSSILAGMSWSSFRHTHSYAGSLTSKPVVSHGKVLNPVFVGCHMCVGTDPNRRTKSDHNVALSSDHAMIISDLNIQTEQFFQDLKTQEFKGDRAKAWVDDALSEWLDSEDENLPDF